MSIQCPNCGSENYFFTEDDVSLYQSLLYVISFGFFNPWKQMQEKSKEKFLAGEINAICQMCAYHFSITEKTNKERIVENSNLRSQAEKRWDEAQQKDQEKISNYPRH